MTIEAFADRTLTHDAGGVGSAGAQLRFYTNGEIEASCPNNSAMLPSTEKWWDPAPDSGNPGDDYWIRFTTDTGPWGALYGNNLYAFEIAGGYGATGWVRLNSMQALTVQENPPGANVRKVGTVIVEIASDSAGNNIVASATYTFDLES